MLRVSPSQCAPLTSSFLFLGRGAFITAQVHMLHPWVPAGSACPDSHRGSHAGIRSTFSLCIHAKSLSPGEWKGHALGHVAWGLGAGLTPVSGLPDLPPPLALTASWSFHPSIAQCQEHSKSSIYLLTCDEGSVYRTPSKNNIFVLWQQNIQNSFLPFLKLWQQLNAFLFRTIQQSDFCFGPLSSFVPSNKV